MTRELILLQATSARCPLDLRVFTRHRALRVRAYAFDSFDSVMASRVDVRHKG